MININKTKTINENHRVQLKDIIEATEDLREVHRQYCAILGIESVAELPDLIPTGRRKPRALDPNDDDDNAENEEADGEAGGKEDEEA